MAYNARRDNGEKKSKIEIKKTRKMKRKQRRMERKVRKEK